MLSLLLLKFAVALPSVLDEAAVGNWSTPYRNWHYYPNPIIPSTLKIPGHEDFYNFDVPTIYQLEEHPGKWFMSFIGFNGNGYNSFVAESNDLIHWENYRLASGFGAPGEFDYGGRVIGAYLYHKWDVKAPRTLRRKDGLYWTLYGCYPKQGGYEICPGQEGLASSKDGLVWERAWPEQTLSVYQKDVKEWEKDCIYQPWLIDIDGKYYCFYNAAHKTEQTGFATSHNLINWTRYPDNPVVRNRPLWYDGIRASDPKVFWDGDHWSMFYFGGGRGGATIMYAASTDLEHWTADREPLYKPGGNPHGLDRQHCLKIALVWNAQTETFYMFYCGIGSQGQCIALLTSKPLV